MKFRLCLIAMLALIAISKSRAAETNSSAVIENLFAGPRPQSQTRPPITGHLMCAATSLRAIPPCRRKNSTFSPTTLARRWIFHDLREGLGKLQLLYRDLGFATISVTLPQQKLTNGFVRIKIIEGRLTGTRVEGNRYFSSNNVLRALPSLDTNILLNTKVVSAGIGSGQCKPRPPDLSGHQSRTRTRHDGTGIEGERPVAVARAHGGQR